MKNDKKQTGRVNYFMVVAGGYLIYLAYQLVRDTMKGETTQLWLSVGAAVLFVVVGGLLLLREWKAYQYGQAHIDDPETWSDDPEVLEELASGEADEGDELNVIEEDRGEDEEET